jgi:hypothetical protein
MHKTRNKTKTKSRRKLRKSKKYRGGSYYSYNKNPLLFTSTSTQTGGGININVKDNFLPDGLVNVGRNLMYSSSNNPILGYYPPVNPDPTVQPINKTYMLL